VIQPRETFGNIPQSSRVAFYILALISVGVFLYGIWRRWCLWRMGIPASPKSSVLEFIQRLINTVRTNGRRMLSEAGLQTRVRGHGAASVAHCSLYAGFIVLLLGTTLLELDNIVSIISPRLKFHQGNYYLVYEVLLDLLGLFFLLGTSLFLWRRILRQRNTRWRLTDLSVLLCFLAIGASGYLVEALRLLWQHPSGASAQCSPIGLMLAAAFKPMSKDVKSEIASAFERSALLDSDKIKVVTSGSKVTLTGKVRTYAEQEEAGRVAWAAPGVYDVDNQITVKWSWFGSEN